MTDDEFSGLVRRAIETGTVRSERELGQLFSVSATQVRRWMSGRSLPIQAVRASAGRVLTEAIEERP